MNFHLNLTAKPAFFSLGFGPNQARWRRAASSKTAGPPPGPWFSGRLKVTDAMTTTETSSPAPPADRRPLNFRRNLKYSLLGALILLALVLYAGHRRPQEPMVNQDAGAELAAWLNNHDPKALVPASLVNIWLDNSRRALKKGDLLKAYDYQRRAEDRVKAAARKWPDNPDLRQLSRRAEGLVYEYEKYGGADPPAPGRAAGKTDRYPDETAGAGAAQVNDLFVAGWAELRRNNIDRATGSFNQALNLLDQLLNPGGHPNPEPISGVRHSAVSVPPQPVERKDEIRYLSKYYAVTARLSDVETRAGQPGRAEAVRRRALAAMDQALNRGADLAELNEYLNPLLNDLARAERLSGRLESARSTLQRRLELGQYMLTHLMNSGQASPAAAPTSADFGTSLRVARYETLLELAWLDRHTFHYDEGLEYTAEIMNAPAEQPQPAALAEAGRRARLIRGEMLMDLGRFQEAEPALRAVLAFQSVKGPQPDEAAAERRVTDIKANLALAELRLAQGDPQAASRFMEEAVALYRVLPGGNPVTFDVQLVRVKVLARRGDSQRAERELAGFLAGAPTLLASPDVDIWVKRQILALMAEAAWQARARGETQLAIEHYRRVNDELTPYITGIEVDKASEYGSLFRPILVEVTEGEGDLRADLRQMSQAESRYALGLDMARALRDQEPRQYFWQALFTSLAAKVERFHY